MAVRDRMPPMIAGPFRNFLSVGTGGPVCIMLCPFLRSPSRSALLL